jgi:hypothetical protein
LRSAARRTRGLLAIYPAEHRRKHQDEMLGVLMTGAHAGQHGPGLRDTSNLIWGATLRVGSPISGALARADAKTLAAG